VWSCFVVMVVVVVPMMMVIVFVEVLGILSIVGWL
jgi:hypothetical protein